MLSGAGESLRHPTQTAAHLSPPSFGGCSRTSSSLGSDSGSASSTGVHSTPDAAQTHSVQPYSAHSYHGDPSPSSRHAHPRAPPALHSVDVYTRSSIVERTYADTTSHSAKPDTAADTAGNPGLRRLGCAAGSGLSRAASGGPRRQGCAAASGEPQRLGCAESQHFGCAEPQLLGCAAGSGTGQLLARVLQGTGSGARALVGLSRDVGRVRECGPVGEGTTNIVDEMRAYADEVCCALQRCTAVLLHC